MGNTPDHATIFKVCGGEVLAIILWIIFLWGIGVGFVVVIVWGWSFAYIVVRWEGILIYLEASIWRC